MSEQTLQGPLVVLVVDDQAGIRRLLQEVFTESGHTVWLAAGGEQAVELVRTHGPDVALVDVKMPGMSGIDALTEILQIEPRLPVIMMTAYGETEVMDSAYRHGARHVIPKPFDIEEVKRAVYRVVSEARTPIAAEGKAPYGSE